MACWKKTLPADELYGYSADKLEQLAVQHLYQLELSLSHHRPLVRRNAQLVYLTAPPGLFVLVFFTFSPSSFPCRNHFPDDSAGMMAMNTIMVIST
jgi:hypothetical protein